MTTDELLTCEDCGKRTGDVTRWSLDPDLPVLQTCRLCRWFILHPSDDMPP